MEIIEIGRHCICARISGEVPKDRIALISVAEKIFESCSRQLYENPEITAYSNGTFSLVFISRNVPTPILHNFVS